jgi:F-box interacting protein
MDLPEAGAGVQRDLAADVLADILMRLPPNTRRLLRLVCRHWRDVVGARTATNLRSRAKTLVATTTGSAHIVDDLSLAPDPETRHRELRTFNAKSMVGTCNGLICLCDHGGAITVANPVTHRELRIPRLPPPCSTDRGKCYNWSRHEAYGFTYLPITGLYKVVHVPCHVNRSSYDRVHVITLGDTSWRDVPAGPDAKCELSYGVVSVDGATYWAAPEGTEKVMVFDLQDERVTSNTSLPSVLSNSKNDGRWHLAEVQGRLGIVFSRVSSTMDKTEVWVMEGATGVRQHIRWSCWYIVQVSTPTQSPSTRIRRLTWPLFVHGEHVLTWEWSLDERGCVLYRHTPINNTGEAKHGVVEITETNRGTRVTNIDIAGYNDDRRTFGYVETKEPLSIYKPRTTQVVR